MDALNEYAVFHMTWLTDLLAKNPAYLDPGSGSFFLQLLLATLMGALFLVGAYWKKVKSFVESGLYQELVEARLLIPHQEKPDIQSDSPLAFKILRPDPVEFISYPYEWSFSQYKDAALLHLG